VSNANVAAVTDLVSTMRKDGRHVVRLRCADYGDEWVVDCDVFPAEAGQAHTAGPYRFGSAQEARRFVETSLLALEMLGCDAA
jgi:hypothetical protein